MNARLLLVALEREPDIVLVRKRTRRVAELLGFDRQDQTRITTAVSELARNAFEYAGGGRAEFRVRDDAAAHAFEIIISDKGPGIADLDAVLSGSQPSEKGMGVGLRGARRLMDAFHIESASRPWHDGARCQVPAGASAGGEPGDADADRPGARGGRAG